METKRETCSIENFYPAIIKRDVKNIYLTTEMEVLPKIDFWDHCKLKNTLKLRYF
jgi:hypothetical protein